MGEIVLSIDGQEVKAKEGDTVLDAAQKAGIDIPTLCAHPALPPYGACRLCIVEIEGIRGYPTACTTPASDGMLVRTKTPEIIELRRNILKLLLSGHTSPCMVCPHREDCEKYRPKPTKSGKVTRCTFCSNRASCELRKLAEEYEIDDLELPIIYRNLPLERLDPFMDRDYNLCVLCGRCVRICEKLHGKGAIAFLFRGENARVGTVFNRDHTESGCLFCGACIDICPTGALSDRYAKWFGIPDAEGETVCTLCPLGCSLVLKTRDGKVTASKMTEFTKEARVCVVGRFVLPQLFNHPKRILSHKLCQKDGFVTVPYEQAVSEAAEKLSEFKGDKFALLTHPSIRENIHILKKFTKEVMQSSNFILVGNEKVSLEPSVEAVISTGDLIDTDSIKNLKLKIVIDNFPSEVADEADIVFASTLPAEVGGTFLSANGVREVKKVVEPPEGLHPEWKIITDIAMKMGAGGFDYRTSSAVKAELEKKGLAEEPPTAPSPSPLDETTALPRTWRGHSLSSLVPSLKALYREEPPVVERPCIEEGFRIVEKKELVPNMHMLKVEVPVIAKKSAPGQFVVVIVNERSERIPYTIADYDREVGTVTLVVQEVGRSSRELVMLSEGDRIAHIAGPLGTPVEIKNYGTVLCGGGCYGIGAIMPLARALKNAGNRVICVAEASSKYLLYWRDELSSVCDELIVATKDGSEGVKGGIQEVIEVLVERGERIDQAFVVGCTFMMMLVSDVAKRYNIPIRTAVNSIMLDGTGMCGVCRVTVGGETKFACVDGPFLNGQKIDWVELMQRRSAYGREEIEALPQDHRGLMHPCYEV